MRRKLFALIFVGFLTVILSVAVNANPDGPRISEPSQYSEHRIGSNVTIKWNAPNSSYGSVNYYIVAVRGFKQDENVTSSYSESVVIQNVKIPSTNRSYTIKSEKLLENISYKKYRISVCAVMQDGTNRWSDYKYFYISAHNTPLNRPISFHIYNGFTADSKDQVYYSCQNWNGIIALGYEIMNTYPYSKGTNKTSASCDGENIVTKGVLDDATQLMLTTTWSYAVTTSKPYRLFEADIVVNKEQPWANSKQTDKLYFYNVMMHEMGHVAGLIDKYDSWAKEWTMYASSYYNEDNKITLSYYDIMDVTSLYD